MADQTPLSDNQIGDRLFKALEMLGEEPGETIRGDAAISAARKALAMMQIGLLMAAEKGLNQVPGIIDPSSPQL